MKTLISFLAIFGLSMGSLLSQSDLQSRLTGIKKLSSEQKVILQDSLDLATATMATQAQTQSELLALKVDHSEMGILVGKLGEERDAWQKRSVWFEGDAKAARASELNWRTKYGTISGRVHIAAIAIGGLVATLLFIVSFSSFRFGWAKFGIPLIVCGGGFAAVVAAIELFFRWNL